MNKSVNQTATISPREIAQQKYNTARINLILMVGLTVLNVVMAFVGSDSMMLFSAIVPYIAAVWATMPEFATVMVPLISLAVISVVAYFLCWIFSKKHFGFMIAALVLFVIDTLGLVGFYLLAGEVSGILDIVIHIWVLYYLILGVVNGVKLSKMPEEVQSSLNGDVNYSAQTSSEDAPAYINENTPAIRRADTEVKSRTLVAGDAFGHHIEFRRVKRVNELVIDGWVYDEVEMLIENAHCLNARIDGVLYQVGYDGSTHCYIRANGNEIAKKLRLI